MKSDSICVTYLISSRMLYQDKYVIDKTRCLYVDCNAIFIRNYLEYTQWYLWILGEYVTHIHGDNKAKLKNEKIAFEVPFQSHQLLQVYKHAWLYVLILLATLLT